MLKWVLRYILTASNLDCMLGWILEFILVVSDLVFGRLECH